jgi:hypothetical protein
MSLQLELAGCCVPPCSEGLERVKGELVPDVVLLVVGLPAGLGIVNKFGVPDVFVDVAPKRPPPDGCVEFPNILPGAVEPVLPVGFAGNKSANAKNN